MGKKMKTKRLLYPIFFFVLITAASNSYSQDNNQQEKIVYYQMEPFDDSLFVQIQKEVFIDPPDPKAEIIVDLRQPSNRTVSIKGALYPFLAFTPETRAKIIVYPFKLNLENTINYASVFTRVAKQMNFNKIVAPPSFYQINSTLAYINPFLQLSGGERFGIPIKKDLGISFGLGTPYSGILETNFIEANFHVLGFSIGIMNSIDGLAEIKKENNHNNIYITDGIQASYVIPLGNFFEFSYQKITSKPSESQMQKFHKYDTLGYKAKVLHGDYYSWEFRYPIRVLGSTRAKFYVGRYLDELHLGFTGRELSLAGSIFDLSFDLMPVSDVRQPQYIFNLMLQKLSDDWAFSAFAIGPSITLSKTDTGKFGAISMFINLRLKVGTSY